MVQAASRRVAVVGAGIAGLTVSLCLAGRGFDVDLFERANRLEEVGAGLQLSPNATRILAHVGALERLMAAAVAPDAISIRDGSTLGELARLPLGTDAEGRWRAPYLVAHRADLQSALASVVRNVPKIRLITGATVRDAAFHARGVTVSVDRGGSITDFPSMLLVGADGVWSTIRNLGGGRAARPSGYVAWRSTLHTASVAGEALAARLPERMVHAFLHPDMHLVTYPLRGGAAINVVAVTRGGPDRQTWAQEADEQPLREAFASFHPALSTLAADASPWTAWPIHTVDAAKPWTANGTLALIGDAAHAMTPFAAQGAAMAIEDAWVLAAELAASPDDTGGALARYEGRRRPRIARVARRGDFNRFTWHARGVVAGVRNLVLGMRSQAALTADFDWLYGYDAG